MLNPKPDESQIGCIKAVASLKEKYTASKAVILAGFFSPQVVSHLLTAPHPFNFDGHECRDFSLQYKKT